MDPVIATTLGDEYRYLDQWFGPEQYRLAGRKLEYRDGRAYDVLDVIANNQLMTLKFDATAFRPRAPENTHTDTIGIPGGLLIPVAVLAAIIGYQWFKEREEKD